MEKKKYLAISVTTQEAMEMCFAEQALLFCIENPLYSVVRHEVRKRTEAIDYDIFEDEEKQIMLFKKVAGDKRFNNEQYEPFYFPLSWEEWHS